MSNMYRSALETARKQLDEYIDFEKRKIANQLDIPSREIRMHTHELQRAASHALRGALPRNPAGLAEFIVENPSFLATRIDSAGFTTVQEEILSAVTLEMMEHLAVEIGEIYEKQFANFDHDALIEHCRTAAVASSDKVDHGVAFVELAERLDLDELGIEVDTYVHALREKGERMKARQLEEAVFYTLNCRDAFMAASLSGPIL